jgi:membrane protease YdiL (CAAX protease family)
MLPKIETIRPKNQIWKFIQYPLTRIFLAATFVILGVVAAQTVINLFGASATNTVPAILSIVIALLAIYFAYRLYVTLIEQRPVYELSADGAVQELATGILIGIGLVTATIGVLWLSGSYQVSGMNPWLVLIPALAANVPSGFLQEILFRGILLRISEESLGTWIALALRSVGWSFPMSTAAQYVVDYIGGRYSLKPYA